LKASLEYVQAGLRSRDVPAPAPASGAVRELPASLAQIYDTHFDFVWRNARRLGVPEASADDVAQDVFMIVQRRITTYDGRASMQSWIFGILVRVVSSHRRSYRRKGARNVSLDHEATRDVPASADETPVAQLERAERTRVLSRLLDDLDEDKRALLILAELEDWTLREIAELYGSNINTIHSRLRAAKRDFERAYQKAQAGQSGKGGSR
jgi:RNA polymerase sigma-70 factor (ECF subfamily)